MKNTPHFLGSWMSVGSPAIVELAADCGLDWVLLDLEHGEFDEGEIAPLLRALKGSNTLGVVRVSGCFPDQIARVLDRGADGVMVPHVNSVDVAKQIVDAMHYPPTGSRGVSRTVRTHRYGRRALQERMPPLFFAQIEDLEGVEEAESIAAVAGVDSLFIGPADLRHVLSLCPEARSFDACVDTVVRAANTHQKQTGILVRNVEDLSLWEARGISWIAHGSDLGVLRNFYESICNPKTTD